MGADTSIVRRSAVMCSVSRQPGDFKGRSPLPSTPSRKFQALYKVHVILSGASSRAQSKDPLATFSKSRPAACLTGGKQRAILLVLQAPAQGFFGFGDLAS